MYKLTNFYLLLILIILLYIIIACAYYNTIKETFTNNKTIILMGDSILNNSNYVKQGESVFDLLKIKTNKVLNIAKDNATINDLYNQLDEITYDLNTEDTYIFISAGGNNILNRTTQITNDDLTKIFNNYKKFLNSLKTKLTNVKINILNLYLPTNSRYQIYNSIINTWNQLIEQTYNSNTNNLIYSIVDIHSLLTQPSDFVYGYEPSSKASAKLANTIYLTR